MSYGQEVIKPYGEGEKAKQVEEMFDNIAPSYDKLNHRLSWNIDKGWRRKAIRQLAPFKPDGRPSDSWHPSSHRPCSTSPQVLATSPSLPLRCYTRRNSWERTSARG